MQICNFNSHGLSLASSPTKNQVSYFTLDKSCTDSDLTLLLMIRGGGNEEKNAYCIGFPKCYKHWDKELFLNNFLINFSHTIFVHIRQIDLITEHHYPFAELNWSQHCTIRSTSVLAIVIKCLQHQLWCSSTGEVQSNNLAVLKKVTHDWCKLYFCIAWTFFFFCGGFISALYCTILNLKTHRGPQCDVRVPTRWLLSLLLLW